MVPLKYQGIVGDPVEANYDHLNGSTKAKSFPRGQVSNLFFQQLASLNIVLMRSWIGTETVNSTHFLYLVEQQIPSQND